MNHHCCTYLGCMEAVAIIDHRDCAKLFVLDSVLHIAKKIFAIWAIDVSDSKT